MDQLLIPYKTLFTVDEHSQLKHSLVVNYLLMGMCFLSFFISVFLLCLSAVTGGSYIPAIAFFVFTCGLVWFSLRKSKRKDQLESELLDVMTERLQDEIFLRHGVIPTRKVRLNEEDVFVDVNNAECRGIVFFTKNGTPQFAEVK